MKKRNLTILLIAAALILVFITGLSVNAAPVQQEGNLLKNASFEQPYVNGAAEGWSAWNMETEKTDDECLSGYHFIPKWNMETEGAYVNNGIASQYVGNNWDTWAGGVYQTIDVTPGATYRFSFYSKGRTSSEPAPDPSDFAVNMNVRAGIDPNGSGQWYDTDVVWGGSSSPHDNWQQFSVEATATGEKMTVFTGANLGVQGVNQCRQFLDTWYDNAELVLVAGAAPPTAPPAPAATAAPANTPVPQPTATEEIAPTVEPQPADETESEAEAPDDSDASSGAICVNAFHDTNANGQQDPNEGYMADVTITLASQNSIVGSAVSEGTETAHCFYDLEAGNYQVAQQLPAHLLMTSAANVAVQLPDNATVAVSFGSRVRGEPISEAVPDETAPGDPASSEDAQTGGQTKPTSGGMICVNAFHDENANASIDPNEGYMAGVSLTLSSDSEVIGQVVSTGEETPLCFDNLQPGPYEVTQQVPSPLEMTTAGNAMVAVAEGQAMQVEFGSRLRMSDTGDSSSDTADGDVSTPAAEGEDDGGIDWLTIGGLAAIILGVILLGALIFFLLRR